MKEHWSRHRVDFERRQPQQLGCLLSFIDLWFTELLTFLTVTALHRHKEAVTLRSEVGWQLPNAMWMGPSSVKQKQAPLVFCTASTGHHRASQSLTNRHPPRQRHRRRIKPHHQDSLLEDRRNPVAGRLLAAMGCGQSKIDQEEAVCRCRERKRLMADAVQARNAFAAAHTGYTVRLKSTGGALSDFAQGEAPDPSLVASHSQQHAASAAVAPAASISTPPGPSTASVLSAASPPPPPPFPDFSHSSLQRSSSTPPQYPYARPKGRRQESSPCGRYYSGGGGGGGRGGG
ncbi:hypothetical protein PR202_ga31429 [Eleusine coracana subsp. coracana]|uniref:DUF630 domain-containing protein n=1 Tax=Eleusine coracana subsp. coracana TaxID=191504 RepID=A0AAV5DSB0_ELECO|nr:hypothetical protein PR202_ga31429 [Eleusine coracana subsp. coracana]